MGLLSRVFRFAVGFAIVSILVSLPMVRADRNSGSGIAPSIAWAGGSPDETLNPQPTPPPVTKVSAIHIGIGQVADTQGTRRSIRTFTALERWQLFSRVFRMFAHRL